jgi:formylglycine-generating enzyme required for sulfatase activity
MRQIMDVLEDAKTRLNLVFLDACRNNPYARSFRSASDGLNRVNAPSGTLISFATRPGSVAADGTGRNGLYTGALLEQMNNPNQPIEQILKKVVSQVKAGSNSQQEPWMEGSIEGEFCFGECGKQVAQSGVSDDRVFWESVKDSRDVNEVNAYLEQFPRGIFAGIARARVAALNKAEPQVAMARPPQAPAAAPLTKDMRPGSVHQDCAECPEMVVIPAGRFVMGAPPGEEEREKLPENFRNRSQPQHDVKISSFMAGRYEITVGQYRAFAMATNRSSNGGCFVWNGTEWKNDTSKDWRSTGFPQNDSHPVACVSFDDAMAYVQWLQQKTGQSYRLLTEAEWEYAARAETRTARYWGDDANVSCAYANVLDLKAKTTIPGASNWATFNCDDGFAYTAPVGSFKANGLGLYDMLGNVWEWTQDCWNDNYAGAPTDGSAWTAGDCSRRVARGGSWFNFPQILRAAIRSRNSTANRYNDFGFRVARTF